MPVVAPDERSKRVGSELVEAACEMLADMRMAWAEAYPLSEAPAATEHLPREARSYHGSLSMCRRVGFAAQCEVDGMTVVRRRLGGR